MICLTLLVAASFAAVAPPPPAEVRFNLFRARPEVEAERVWAQSDAAGLGLTGTGVLVCDVDAAPDIFHPMFFKADGGRFAWIDVDGNGEWSAGDAVDMNGDGRAGPDETLAWLPYDGEAFPGLDRTRFQPGYDFLYQDANGNGVRDYGPPAFTESDPCYGEAMFLADDTNGNGRLDAGEPLIGLKTSKIRAIYDQRVYRRGVDLIEHPVHAQTHGSLVCGVVAGGWAGRHQLTGIAPDAELLCAVSGNTDALRWAEEEGADVVLWEYGGPYSDGGSELEQAVDAMVGRGVLFVAGAGNDRAPKRHALFSGEAERTLANRDSVGVTLQLAWRGAAPNRIRLGAPGTVPRVVLLQPGFFETTDVNGYIGAETQSGRGTSFQSLRFAAGAGVGNWTVSFPGATDAVHAWVLYGFEDRGADWVGGDAAYTVTSPGAADSAVTVAAYENYGLGDVAWFSGEGPSLDGRQVLDIAAPGVGVLSTTTGQARFESFTGTSAAIPFVAGAAALLRQAFPALTGGGLRRLLAAGAAHDSLTGNANRWGAGRLRIHAALVEGLTHPELAGPTLTVRVAPNPAHGPLEIAGRCPEAEGVEVRIFSLQGALVWETRAPAVSGAFHVRWDGLDYSGRRAPSGFYFAHVKQGRSVGVGKLVLVR